MSIKAGVWIDHKQAILVLLADAGNEIEKIASGIRNLGIDKALAGLLISPRGSDRVAGQGIGTRHRGQIDDPPISQ